MSVEPGERAQALLRIADEAFTVGGYVKAQAAATMAGVYLEAAKLDRQERAEQEAAEQQKRFEEQQKRLEEDFRSAGLPPYGLPPESSDAPA